MGVAAQVIEELKAIPPKRNAPGGGNRFLSGTGEAQPLPKRETPRVQPPPVGQATRRHVD